MQSLVLEEIAAGSNALYEEGKTHPAFGMCSSMIPLLEVAQNKEDLKKMEDTLQYFPIDEFVRRGTELQRKQLAYQKKKEDGTLSRADKRRYKEEMYQLNTELNLLAKKMFALADDDRVLPLFQKPGYLRAQTGFQYDRGLAYVIQVTDTMIAQARKEGLTLQDPDKVNQMQAEADKAYVTYGRIPEAQERRLTGDMKKALDLLGTKRLVGVFGKEDSKQYTTLKNAAADLNKAFEALKSGKNEKDHLMTLAERAAQIEKIRSLAETAEKAADAYIAKSFKGNKSPSTWAGLDRVNGATRLKFIAAELKKLEKVNVAEAQKVQEQGAQEANEALENPQVKERNINEIAAKNGINILNDNTANKNYKRTVAKDGPVAGPKQTVKTGPGMGNTGN